MAAQSAVNRVSAVPPGTSLAAFFESVLDTFGRAVRRQAGPPVQHLLRIGGRSLRLTFAGPAMVGNVLPALAHLVTGVEGSPALEIAIGDHTSTGEDLPLPPWEQGAGVVRGTVLGLIPDPDIEMAYAPDSGQLSMLHRGLGRAVLWMPDARRCPYWEQAAPLRALLHWWAAGCGQQLVHGAAVGDENGALLLTGRGGSGKSTTALAALVGGMCYLGDDYVLCDRRAGQPRVHSLYNTAKIDRSAEQRLLELSGRPVRAGGEGQEKGVLYVAELFPSQLGHCRPLRAIVVPRVNGAGRHRVRELSPAKALLALAPTTLFQLPGAGPSSMALLRELVVSLPCYQLDLGADLGQIPSLLRELLAEGA